MRNLQKEVFVFLSPCRDDMRRQVCKGTFKSIQPPHKSIVEHTSTTEDVLRRDFTFDIEEIEKKDQETVVEKDVFR